LLHPGNLHREEIEAFDGRGTMRWLMVVMVVLVAACAADEPPNTRASDKVGYDVSKDAVIQGQYLVSGAYPEGQGVNPNEVKWRTLLRGAEAIRKDGYDLMVWAGPRTGAITQTTDYVSRSGAPLAFSRHARFMGVTYVVRGYMVYGNHPPNARPVSTVIDRIAFELTKQQP
jgi:hypothetical protein